MVRRWSYINSVNNVNLFEFNPGRTALFDVAIDTTMYLRKEYQMSTKITRHRWARRKHLYDWISLANILKDWAKLYRFYRKYNKFVFNQYFTKTALISFNLVSSMNSIPCLFKGTEDVVAATTTRKVLRYFQQFHNPRLKFLIRNKHLARMVLSYDVAYSNLSTWDEKSPFTPLLQDQVKTLTPYRNTNLAPIVQAKLVFLNALTWPFVNSLLTVKVLYRFLVLLTYLRIRR